MELHSLQFFERFFAFAGNIQNEEQIYYIWPLVVIALMVSIIGSYTGL